jgi:thiol-disulfide isomerase/thioredoxin
LKATSMGPIRILSVFLPSILFLASCVGEIDGRSEKPEGDVGEAPTGALTGETVEVSLSPQLPDPESGRTMRWSPYGQRLSLVAVDGGMDAILELGPEGTPPVSLHLFQSSGSEYFDGLYIDIDRDGEFASTELHRTEVSETRNKFWSSFEAVVGIPVIDPGTGREAINPYPLSLWYVYDPRMPTEEPVIRFSRRGWMEGSVTLDGVPGAVMVTENLMDGVFTSDDSWALASRDSAGTLLQAGQARSLNDHAWLSEQAYIVTELDPSGRRIRIAPVDPGITRAEEEEMNDHLAVDRRAERSGDTVAFHRDFEEAEALAQREGKPLFVDFETVWCGPCKVMDEWVYTADAVVAASRSVVAVKVDGDERLDLKERFGVTGFPTVILLGTDGQEIRRAAGYVNVADMSQFLVPSG